MMRLFAEIWRQHTACILLFVPVWRNIAGAGGGVFVKRLVAGRLDEGRRSGLGMCWCWI